MNNLRFVIIVAIGLLCAGVETGVGQEKGKTSGLTRESATEHLKHIEAWSKQTKSLTPTQMTSAIMELKNNPEVSVPLLFESFRDASKKRDFRADCGEILSEMKEPISPEQVQALTALMRNSHEEPLLRIYAAQFMLRDNAIASTSKSEILNMADRFLQEGKEKAFVRLSIMPQFVGDAKAVKVMLKELQRGSEIGPSLWVLGKLKGREAIQPIAQLLGSQFDNKDFPKTRAYLSLGEIGGGQAYDVLLGYLGKERKETKQHIILRAIGLTRDPRAKNFLIDYLQNKPIDFYVSTLRGMQYFGDGTLIPVLEKELQRPLPAYEKSMLEKTIKAIKDGQTNPEW